MNDFDGLDEGWFLNTVNRIGQLIVWFFTHVIGYVVLILFIVYLFFAITSGDDPSGRCDYEPGPNGITIANCEPEN